MTDLTTVGIICQVVIGITGCLSVWMIHSSKMPWRRIACILALIGQPAWFYAAVRAQQWGIFLMDVIATVAWAHGLWLNCQNERRE